MEFIPGFSLEIAIIEIIHSLYPDIALTKITDKLQTIKECISQVWTSLITSGYFQSSEYEYIVLEIGNMFKNIDICKTSDFYQILINKPGQTPTTAKRWEAEFGEESTTSIWKLINMKYKHSKWIELQFKMHHNVVFTTTTKTISR